MAPSKTRTRGGSWLMNSLGMGGHHGVIEGTERGIVLGPRAGLSVYPDEWMKCTPGVRSCRGHVQGDNGCVAAATSLLAIRRGGCAPLGRGHSCRVPGREATLTQGLNFSKD